MQDGQKQLKVNLIALHFNLYWTFLPTTRINAAGQYYNLTKEKMTLGVSIEKKHKNKLVN